MEHALTVHSPYKKVKIPEVNLLDFVFEGHQHFSEKQLNRPWIVDVPSGKNVTFGQVGSNVKKIASALAKLGFKKGDLLFFVTPAMTELYLFELAVWMLGGGVKGASAVESHEHYLHQLNEMKVKYILVDIETHCFVKKAVDASECGIVQYFSCGEIAIEGTAHISDLLLDDGLALPEKVNVDVHEDILVICNTSGSTGKPKGVVHTHYSITANLLMLDALKVKDSIMEFVINYGVVNVCLTMYALRNGLTIYHLNKFDKKSFLPSLLSLRPRSIMLYPYLASSFARDPMIDEVRQRGFLKHVMIAGWVLDSTTAALLSKNLPHTQIQQVYGMSEVLFASVTDLPDSEEPTTVPTINIEGTKPYTSQGALRKNAT